MENKPVVIQNGTPTSVSESIKSRKTSYEETQKQKIISVCSNPKVKYADALNFIENEIQQSRRMSSFHYSVPCWKSDGVYQLNRAIDECFGVAKSKQDNSPSGNTTMETVDVQLADGSRVKVPYGTIDMADLGEDSTITIAYDESKCSLEVTGKCQFKFSSLMDDIIARTQALLSTDSIYRNQILEINDKKEPHIMDLSGIDKQPMVLSKKTQFELAPLRSRILYPQKCFEKGIPLKYGCLFEGKYGTGKTLLAFKLAREAVQNGWAFIYLKDPTLLAHVLRMSKVIDKSGPGIIIFVEDIDQVTRGDRDAAMQDILNTLDGGDTKDLNVITLFTTNHIELINPTMLRGKRIGSIITMDTLDKETAQEFVQSAFGTDEGYTLEGDFTSIYELIEKSEIAPAFMAEIIESVKSKMLFLETNVVLPEYLHASVESYQRQVSLAKKKDNIETTAEKLANALKALLCENSREHEELTSQLAHMAENHFDDDLNDYE